MTARVRSAGTRWAVLPAVIALGVMLAACTSNPVQPIPEPALPTAQPGTQVPENPEIVPEPVPTGIPVDIPCEQLITPEQLASINPTFAVDATYTVAPGSLAESITELHGVSCGWVDQSSGETIEAAVAHLEPADIERRKNEAVTRSNMVPTYNPNADEGYFFNDGSAGTADVFVGDYWIVTTSSFFFEPGDAEQVVGFLSAAVR